MRVCKCVCVYAHMCVCMCDNTDKITHTLSLSHTHTPASYPSHTAPYFALRPSPPPSPTSDPLSHLSSPMRISCKLLRTSSNSFFSSPPSPPPSPCPASVLDKPPWPKCSKISSIVIVYRKISSELTSEKFYPDKEVVCEHGVQWICNLWCSVLKCLRVRCTLL